MHSPLVLLVAALAGSSMAVPWNVEIRLTGSSSHQSISVQPPKPSGGGSGPPTTGKPHPPPPNPPVHNSTVTNTHSTSKTWSTTETNINTRSTSKIWSTTEIITKTTFIPTSTPIALPGGTTEYSTWLTTKTYVTTTCYPITSPTPKSTSTFETKPTQAPPAHSPPAITNCPAAPTVTVTVTKGATGSGVYYTQGAAPHNCDKCQTITYTNVYGGTDVIVIPAPTSQPPHSNAQTKPTESKTDTTKKPTQKPTPPYPTGGSSILHPSGTGAAKPPHTTATGAVKPPHASGSGYSPKPSGW